MLLSIHQNQQSMADFRAIAARGLVNGEYMCKPDCTEPAHRHHVGDSTHFRTPSPHGQLVSLGAMLPTFFRYKALIWRYYTHQCRLLQRELCVGINLLSVPCEKATGDKQCHLRLRVEFLTALRSKLHFLQPLIASPLPHVVIQARTKRYLAARQVPASRLLRSQTLLKVQLLARQATLSIVRSTPKNTTEACDAEAQRLFKLALPCVKTRHFVLSIPKWAKTAQLRGSINETSSLHFCSSSHISGRCMHEVRRGIQSRRNIAVGSTDGRVINPRLTAHFNNHMASTVPHQRGGFLRFPIQTQPFSIQKDILCSTRS
jgi:hypothetical protein